MRRVTLVLVGVLFMLLSGCDLEKSFQDMLFVNAYRAQNGASELQPRVDICRKADKHAEAMFAARALFHSPDLSAGITGPWARMGENVGVGGSVEDIETTLRNSRSHDENMLDVDWDYGCTAVVGPDENGTLYLVQEFVTL